ncbi:MAG: hypothetical protein JW927_12480 [Deltaproteobacteria bacterium]|nr:hypothetical protein [Deltaproteobacteria bacterium]
MEQNRHMRKLTAIFSADVVGFSRLMEEDEDWTINTLEDNKRLISEFIEEYKGRVVDAPGDNVLAEFSSVTNAVECAVKIQHELKHKNANLIECRRMEFRIGVNLGEVIEDDGHIYGSGVNIAARLEGLTEAGGICISRRAYDHVKTQLDLGFEYLGEHCVKNISEPIRVYRVLMETKDAGKVIGENNAPNQRKYKIVIAALIILIIVAAGLIFWSYYPSQSDKIEQAFTESPKINFVIETKKALKTIAVIPFVSVSSDHEQENFVDGLSLEIISRLLLIKGLNVSPSTSSFAFKNTDRTAREIAVILGREYILEGNVRKVGDALRINVQLFRASDDSHLWSETYDLELKNILAIQEKIATKVADELKVTLGEKSTRELGSTNNLEAYEIYMVARGQYFLPIVTSDSYLQKSLKSINAAIALDPDFALAWTLKATIHLQIAANSPNDRVVPEYDNALQAAQRAINIERNLAEAYIALGRYRSWTGDWIEAELAFRKAVKLKNEQLITGNEIPYHYICVGHFKKAHEILNEIRLSEPYDQAIRSTYIICLGLIGDKKGAEEEYGRCEALFGEL